MGNNPCLLDPAGGNRLLFFGNRLNEKLIAHGKITQLDKVGNYKPYQVV